MNHDQFKKCIGQTLRLEPPAIGPDDATVFCMDVGWRKPHGAPSDRALSLLEVAPADALFVGDDHRWDIVGAQNAGLRPALLESDVPKSRPDHLTIPNLAGIIALLAEASL